MIKQCSHCGNEFEAIRVNLKYCSFPCRKRAGQLNRNEWKRNNLPKKGRKGRIPWNKGMKSITVNKKQTLKGYIQKIRSRCLSITPDTDITTDFLEVMFKSVDYRCTITKIPFIYKHELSGSKNPYAPSLDRIDSNIGYYKDNVQLVLNFINRAKNDMSNDDLIDILNKIIEGGKVGGDLVYPIFEK